MNTFKITEEIKNKVTPMMRQYLETKEKYPDCILFYRLGDFYEMFFDDALQASKAMDVTLTGKSCGLEERAPMCGVPYHACETYLAKLISKGFRVAICEQMEDPATAKGIVKREVIRIVTPGTVLSGSMLEDNENNYLSCLYVSGEGAGLAYCDVSTGEVSGVRISGNDLAGLIINELTKINAREIILSDALGESELAENIGKLTETYITYRDDGGFDRDRGIYAVQKQFETSSCAALGLEEEEPLTRALGELIIYLHETQMNSLSHIRHLNISDARGRMSLDRATLKNLELTGTLFENKVQGSLLGVLDKTMTSMGSRKLKGIIRQPFNTVSEINRRLDAVETIYNDVLLKNDLKAALKGIYDMERLSGRIACGNANARDMISLRNSLSYLPELKNLLSGTSDSMLCSLADDIKEMPEVYSKISDAVADDPPFAVKEGGLIRQGYSQELDELKASIKDGQAWIMNLEASERERTGIKNLKVGFNKVFGYYIEVTRANTSLVPDNYIRKQTLVNNERYITAEMKEVESVVLNAETKINNLEYQLFSQLREFVNGYTDMLQQTAEAVGQLDVLVSFADVSGTNSYVRPVISDSDVIAISGGRHPVIEQTIRDGLFVSNDTYLNKTDSSMLLITGPNMAGKSTYMRQTALIVLMAQMGCFVPADRAEIGIADRIFTRIGASDNLTQGQSTFYVEMNELAYILNTAGERSLIILDEIGRGTSTYDGLSIAWAVAEHLCSRKRRIRTLFATHYHELTVLENQLEGLRNLNVGVSEDSGNVVFLHKIMEGSASRSYGIHVAKLAGVPASLLERAQSKLEELESGYTRDNSGYGYEYGKNAPGDDVHTICDQISLFQTVPIPDPVIQRLKNLDILNMTPVQAITVLEELKHAAEKNI